MHWNINSTSCWQHVNLCRHRVDFYEVKGCVTFWFSPLKSNAPSSAGRVCRRDSLWIAKSLIKKSLRPRFPRILHSFACVKAPPHPKKEGHSESNWRNCWSTSKTLQNISTCCTIRPGDPAKGTCCCHWSLLKEEKYCKSNWEKWPPTALLGDLGDLARE